RTAALDGGFGTAGTATSNPAGGFDRVTDMVVVGGNLYVAGIQQAAPFGAPAVRQWRVEKWSAAAGTLVASFGTAGAVTSDLVGDSPALSLAADSTSLYLVGIEEISGDLRLRMEKRFLSTGGFVTDFGFNGIVSENFNADGDGPQAVVLDGSNLYLAGMQDFSADSNVRIEKRDASS